MAKETKAAKSTTPSARKPIAPRKRDYNYGDEGRTSRGVRDSDYTLKPGANVMTVNPKVWEKGGRFVFRPLPMVDPETGDEEAYRSNSEPNQFGDFFRAYPVVCFMGIDQQFDFIPYRKSRSYNPAKQNPYVILRNAIIEAVENGSAPSAKWAPLVSDKNRKAPFPKVKMRYYFQGPVFENVKPITSKDGKFQPLGITEKSSQPLIYLSGSAGDAIIEKLNKKKVGYRGDDMDFENAMEFGDPVFTGGGRFISIWNPDMYDPNAVAGDDDAEGEEVEAELNTDDTTEGGKGGGDYGKGYECEILDAYRPRPKQLYRPNVEKYPHLLKKVVQWDDVIHIPTHEQLCLWIAQAFRSMPELLRFGWQDHPEFFTSEVKAIIGSTKTTAVSAGKKADEEETEEFESEAEDEEGSDVASDSLAEDADVQDYDTEDYEQEDAEAEQEVEEEAAAQDEEITDEDLDTEDAEEDDGSDEVDEEAEARTLAKVETAKGKRGRK